MRITKGARKYDAERAISEQKASQKCLDEESKEFTKKGVEVYAKA
jgi:hypothetical protein